MATLSRQATRLKITIAAELGKHCILTDAHLQRVTSTSRNHSIPSFAPQRSSQLVAHDTGKSLKCWVRQVKWSSPTCTCKGIGSHHCVSSTDWSMTTHPTTQPGHGVSPLNTPPDFAQHVLAPYIIFVTRTPTRHTTHSPCAPSISLPDRLLHFHDLAREKPRTGFRA